jgi:hypothetical protein
MLSCIRLARKSDELKKMSRAMSREFITVQILLGDGGESSRVMVVTVVGLKSNRSSGNYWRLS